MQDVSDNPFNTYLSYCITKGLFTASVGVESRIDAWKEYIG